MKNTHIKFFLILCLLPINALTQPSLCKQDEVTDWSCTAKTKIYSVCSSKNLGAATGYMQYRAGKSTKIEFNFPEKLQHPRNIFQSDMLPRGVSLSFSNGEYKYTITESLSGLTMIDVSKAQKTLATISCDSATDSLTLTETINRFKTSGIDKEITSVALKTEAQAQAVPNVPSMAMRVASELGSEKIATCAHATARYIGILMKAPSGSDQAAMRAGFVAKGVVFGGLLRIASPSISNEHAQTQASKVKNASLESLRQYYDGNCSRDEILELARVGFK